MYNRGSKSTTVTIDRPDKKQNHCRLEKNVKPWFLAIFFIIIIIIIINFFRRVFSDNTEANATTLVPLDTILPEICAFIVGFSCTVWTKMRSLRAN